MMWVQQTRFIFGYEHLKCLAADATGVNFITGTNEICMLHPRPPLSVQLTGVGSTVQFSLSLKKAVSADILEPCGVQD